MAIRIGTSWVDNKEWGCIGARARADVGKGIARYGCCSIKGNNTIAPNTAIAHKLLAIIINYNVVYCIVAEIRGVGRKVIVLADNNLLLSRTGSATYIPV